jgi:micrococcal nuclease
MARSSTRSSRAAALAAAALAAAILVGGSAFPSPSAAATRMSIGAPAGAPPGAPLVRSGSPGAGRIVAAAAQAGTVRKIVDGDTIDVRVAGKTVRVRLLQIDTPEVHSGAECWGRQASAAIARLLPVGTAVTLYADPALDRTDAYGRALRYVFRGTTNVNVLMVARGDAAPYFYRGERGRYAAGLERVALSARRSRLGLWGACPGAVYDPTRSLDTGPVRG